MLKTCIIIEDQPPAQRIIQEYIKDVSSLELRKTFSDAIQALAYLGTENIDLIFLDIHLPKISGIDFLKMLPNAPQVILTTAFSEYALESYEYYVTDYLLKPFSFQRFVQAVNKSMNTLPGSNSAVILSESLHKTFHIKSGYDLVKIESEEILYIKSDKDYTEIITEKKKHLSSNSLKIWIEKLDKSFFQIHKSYIVNTRKMIKVSGNQVQLNNNQILPVGRAFKTSFMNQFID